MQIKHTFLCLAVKKAIISLHTLQIFLLVYETAMAMGVGKLLVSSLLYVYTLAVRIGYITYYGLRLRMRRRKGNLPLLPSSA